MDVQDLIRQLTHIGSRIQTPQEFVLKAMPVLLKALEPVGETLRFYRVVPQGLILMASTVEGDVAREITAYDDLSAYHQVLETGDTTVDVQNQFVLAPLAIIRPKEALLEVWLTAHDTAQQDQAALRSQVGLVTQIFQMMLSDTIKTWALDKLTLISSSLNQATGFESMAEILGHNLISRGQFTSINLFDYEFDGAPKGFWVVATANSQKAFSPNLYVPLEDADVISLQALQANQDVVVYNTPTTLMGTAVRQLLDNSRIRAMYVVPLQVSGRTIGFINTNDTQLLLTNLDAEQRVIRGVSGQVGAIVDNRRLLTEAEASLVETRTLYDASRRLMSAQTLQDMVHIVYDTFAKPQGRVSLMEYIYDASETLTGTYVRYVVADGKGAETNRPMHLGFDEGERNLIRSRSQDLDVEINFTENLKTAWADMPHLVEMVTALNISSLITLSLSDGHKRTHQINLSWAEPRTFDSGQRRLFAAINAQVQIVYKNQSYLREIQQNAQNAERQVRVLRLLNDLNTRAGVAAEEDAFLHEISPLLLEAFQADNISYSEREHKRTSYTLNFSFPPRDIPPDNRVFQAPDVTGREDTVWLIENIAAASLDDNLRAIYAIYNIQSQFLLPIFDSQKTLIGVIGVGYEHMIQIPPETQDLARTFAAQINVGLQKMHLLHRSQRQAQQMEQLALLSQSVQAVLDETTILRTVLRELRRVVPYEYLTILLANDDGILTQAAYATPAETIIMSERKPYDLTKDGIAAQAWQEQGVVHADNVRRTWSWEHPLRASLGSIVALPLLIGGRVLGLIEVGSAAVYAYSETDITALLQVGNQIALALENARELERTERLARNRELANRISTVMQEQMDVETILQAALKEVGKAIGARRARIRLGPQESGPKDN